MSFVTCNVSNDEGVPSQLLFIPDRHRLQMPDFPVIIVNCPICGKLAAARGVTYAHPGPAFAILVRFRHTLLGIDETAEIRSDHPWVVWTADCVNDRIKESELEQIKVAGAEQRHNPLQIVVVTDYGTGIITPAQLIDLLARMTKHEKILLADLLTNFNVRPIKSAYCYGAIHHKLHVTGSGSLLAGR